MENSNNTDEANRRLRDVRDAYVRDLIAPMQDKLIKWFGPLLVLAVFGLCFLIPSWQLYTIAVSVFLMVFISWVFAFKASQDSNIEASASVLVFSTLANNTIAMSLTKGIEAMIVTASISIVIYAYLFSKRLMYFGVAGLSLSIILSETLRFIGFYDLFVLEGGLRLMGALAFGAQGLLIVSVFLRRSQTTNDDLFSSMQNANKKQSELIVTVKGILPMIRDACSQIGKISDQFLFQTEQQTVVMNLVSSSIGDVSKSAKQTVEMALSSEALATESQREALKSTARLTRVEKGFGKIVKEIESVQSKVVALTEDTKKIEEILGFNLEIGGQIKTLSINAAVQAVKAGRYGDGFRVVAGRLKEMIQATKENLDSSTRLLKKMRQSSDRSSEKITSASKQLRGHFQQLRNAASMIENSADNFVQTSKMVSTIAGAAQGQQLEIDAINDSMKQIETAASGLAESAKALAENLETITISQATLETSIMENPVVQ
jgi:methyl-accepting chemotaxis protein